MHASRPPCDPQRSLARADDGVSEVVGQILMFGIMSMVLILSLFSFNIAKDAAEERVLGTTSDAVAQRVASLVVSTALFAETFSEMDPEIESRLELPGTLENRQYLIVMEGTAADGAAELLVRVPSANRIGTAPLFASGAAEVVHVCAQEPIDGGPVRVRVVADSNFATVPDGVANIDIGGVPTPPPACLSGTPETELYVFLEPAP